MPGIIIDHYAYPVTDHELLVTNFRDDDRLALHDGEDCRDRSAKTWIRMIVIHTTVCARARIKPGFGPKTNVALNVARWWSRNGSPGGAQLLVAGDGSVGQFGDLRLVNAYHAGQKSVNARSIGIEIAQGKDGTLYLGQLQVVVRLVDWLCRTMRIQRQCCAPAVALKRIQRVRDGGQDTVGVFSHSNLFPRNKPNDPGPEVFELLVAAGFMPFRFDGDDLEWWKTWQEDIGVDADGVPGPETTDALESAGFGGGLLSLPDPR